MDKYNVRKARAKNKDANKPAGKVLPVFKQASAVTGQVIKKIRTRIPPEIEIYAFEATGRLPYYGELKRISKKNGIKFIDGIPRAIHKAHEEGRVVKAGDRYHWNEAGHEIAAKKLEEYFRKEWEI